MRKVALSTALLWLVASCGVDINVDANETAENLGSDFAPIAEFDPSNSVIPFPNNLLLDPATGLVNLPAQCNESTDSALLRQYVLNALDGFGTFEATIRASFSAPVDFDSLAGNVKLMKRATRTGVVAAADAVEVPTMLVPYFTTRGNEDCTETLTIDAVYIIPLVPLDDASTYTVALLKGIESADGVEFMASTVWGLVRQAANPVTVDETGMIVSHNTPFNPADEVGYATLMGIDLLWKVHYGANTFITEALTVAHEDILLAWEFNTMSITKVLDRSVTDSLADMAPSAALAGMGSLADAASVSAHDYLVGVFMQMGMDATTASQTCAVVGCNDVGDILGGALTAPQYQMEMPNPMTGGDKIPGPFADPIAPTKVKDETIGVLAMIPATAAPATGYPTIIFAHGLTSSKEALFAIGPQLAAKGFATVAIDWVAHGSRAIQNEDNTQLDCGGTPDPTVELQCFAQIFSSDLAGTRDNMRQSVLDQTALVNALENCTGGTDHCGDFNVDFAKLGYMGQSLGALIGSTVVSTNPAIKASVLNVGGIGWVDIIENTDSLALRCSMVDALIDAAVIEGTTLMAAMVANSGDPSTATCVNPDTSVWLDQAGWKGFAGIGRWILDPSDGANFLNDLAGRSFLIQEVIGDEVVPNICQENAAALLGLTAVAAEQYAPANASDPAVPSLGVTPTDYVAPAWIQYVDIAGNASFPGNDYQHASLLRPATDDTTGTIPPGGGNLGTAQMQTDAITYLYMNLGNLGE